MKNPKVLFLNPSNSSYRDGFYKELSKLIDVKFLFYFRDAYGAEGTNYEILKGEYTLPGYSRGFNPTLISKLWNEDYDIVINSDPCSFAAHVAYPIAKIRKKKFVTWTELWQYPKTTPAKLIKLYIKQLMIRSDLCIAAGTRAKKLLKEFGVKKIAIAPDASFDVTKLPMRTSRRLPAKFILQVGHIVDYDGTLELIKAFKKLHKKHKDVELILVGPEGNSYYVSKCKEEAGDLPIHFKGYVNQLRIYYERCLFCIHAAVPVRGLDPVHSWEMSLNEAMSASKPLIATDVIAGAYDLIKQGKNGYMIKPNINSIYKAMLKLCNLKTKDLNSMGKYSRKLYKNKFNHKNMAKQFVEAIKHV